MLAFEALSQFNEVFGVMDEEFYPTYDKMYKVIDAVCRYKKSIEANEIV